LQTSSPEGQGFRKEAAPNYQRKLTVPKRPAKARQNKVNLALAKATSANRATTRARLQQLTDRGTVEKDAGGLWRLAGAESGPTMAPSS
jgi:hypothetical protein